MTGAALALLALVSLQGPPAPLTSRDSARASQLRVFLLTFETGAEIWERFGHNAIWIQDPVEGTDHAYDYGNFNFGEKNFVLNFARGRMRYWMAANDVRTLLARYQGSDRRILSQELALAPQAKLELDAFLKWNNRPENRFYLYDYYLDNCSTRIRDALDKASGGAIRRHGDSVPGKRTYRDHTQRLTENNALLHTALMMGLGQPVDAPIRAWDEMFLPIELRPHLNRVRVAGPDGTLRPIVLEERVLFDSNRYPVPERPTNWVGYYGLVGLAIGGIAFAAGRRRSSSSAARRVFLGVAWTWSVFAGLAGAMLVFFWALTDHRFSVANENVLQLNLLSLALAAFLPKAARGTPEKTSAAMRLAALVVIVSGFGLLLKPLPWFTQQNLDVIALVLPIHLGVLLGLSARSGALQPA